MASDLNFIREFINRLVRRSRLLLVWRSAIGLASLAGLMTLWMLLAYWLGTQRGLSAFVLSAASGFGLWWMGRHAPRDWRAAGETVAHAQVVERHVPELRGRLVTSVERLQGPVEGESSLIIGLLVI